ncbi:MAG: hypothetical protein C4K58_06660 [Flavobacteriaceae bacterium]|nr:MAG: hypothetical protein C4K58_06660 [Flavobacteriaceae bacterium]
MKEIKDILKNISHRTWGLPNRKWSYYQQWNDALFLHWKVEESELQKFTPSNLPIDKFQGESWVSIVAFSMEKIRPRNLPSISWISNFAEINVRTYLTKDNKPGVYFLNIEAQKNISTFIAKKLSGLPYEKAEMTRGEKDNLKHFSSYNKKKNFRFESKFRLGKELTEKSELDIVGNLSNLVIRNDEKFNEIFSMATVMGKQGRPTEIDFSKELVLAVILPETDFETSVMPVSVQKGENGKITLIYQKVVGQKQSYVSKPSFIVVLENEDILDIEFVEL